MAFHRIPVATIAELETLDQDEILEGYWDGRENFPCGANRSRSYWHGWRNGMVDYGHMKGDDAQADLAREVIDTGYLKRLCASSVATGTTPDQQKAE